MVVGGALPRIRIFWIGAKAVFSTVDSIHLSTISYELATKL